MTTHVFIPTRKRPHLIEKTKDKWLAQKNTEVTLVIEPSGAERKAYSHFQEEGFKIMRLPAANMGMGRIRQRILGVAVEMGLPAFVQADDDSYPQAGRVRSLCQTVLESSVVGCGASNSYHGLMIGNKVLDMKATFPIAGGFGHIMFGINTDLALEVGGYPEWATAWGEDTELQRCGIANGMPWYYDTNVRMGSVAKRYSPGGLSSQYKGKRRELQEQMCHREIYARWPNYVSHPSTGRFRCQWKKMMEDYCPGWQRRVPHAVRKAMNLAVPTTA